MKPTRIALAALLLAAFASAAAAGGTLTVQLVKASSGERSGRVDGRLRGVAPALERNLAYTGFSVVESTAMPLPADGNPRMLGEYRIRCAGAQNQLAITVEKKDRPVVKTTVALGDRKPFILGGLPAEDGALMLIFEAR
jgi:hypothetical protein